MMNSETALREIEEATSDLEVFSILLRIFGNEHIQLLLHALAKVQKLALQERRK